MRWEGTSRYHVVQTSYLKQGQLKQVAQLSFQYLKEWRLHNVSGLSIPVCDHSYSKKRLLVSAGCCTKKDLMLVLSSPVALFNDS